MLDFNLGTSVIKNICVFALFRFRLSVRPGRRLTRRAATPRAPLQWRLPPPPWTTWTRRATTARLVTSSKTSRLATCATWTALAWWRCRLCRRCRRPTRPATRTVCTSRGLSRSWTSRPPQPPQRLTTSLIKLRITVSAPPSAECCLLALYCRFWNSAQSYLINTHTTGTLDLIS